MPTRKNSVSGESAAPDMVLTRLLNAPRELVFKVWTDAGELAKWWGPDGFTNPVCEVSARAGGAIRIHMRAPNGTTYPMTGIYQEVVAPERLVFKSAALDEHGSPLFDVLNTVTFVKDGLKTRLTVEARVLRMNAAAAPYLKGQEAGWSQSLGRLESLLHDKQEAGGTRSAPIKDRGVRRSN
jgi:uncharacterized protein YndB with AHSA1/START domain